MIMLHIILNHVYKEEIIVIIFTQDKYYHYAKNKILYGLLYMYCSC